jgi:hypothetical protein
MGASSSVDEAQFNALKNTVNSQAGRINALDALNSKVDNLSTAAASAMDYSKVAEAIDKQTTLRESLATQIAKNPGALADNLAIKIGDKNSAVFLNLDEKLSANSNFQKKIADSISGDSVFKTRIKGDKGEPGTIGTPEALEYNLFAQGRTMWCADGELCQIPTNKKGVLVKGALGAGSDGVPMDATWTGLNIKRRDGKWTHFDWKDDQKNYIRGETRIDGDLVMGGATINRPDGRMHIAGGELLYLLNKNGVIIGKEWGGNGNLQVQGETNTGSLRIGNWQIYQADGHLYFRDTSQADRRYIMLNDGNLLGQDFKSERWNKWASQ